MGEKSSDDAMYKQLNRNDNRSDCDDGELESAESIMDYTRPQRSRRWLIRMTEIIVVITSLLIGFYGMAQARSASASASAGDQTCPIEPFFRSDLEGLEGNGMSWTKHLAGSESGVYMGRPTMEREAAWDNMVKDRAITLSATDLATLNATGEIPSLEGQHKGAGEPIDYLLMSGIDYELNCLRLVRQWSYKSHWMQAMEELPEVFLASREDVYLQVDACLESLRLQVLCSANPMRFLVPSAIPTSGFKPPIVLQSDEADLQCSRH